MQLLTTQMSTKKDSAMAPVVGSTSIVQPDFVAIVAPDVVPSVEVELDVDLHMREVSESPPRLPARSPTPLPRSPSRLVFRGVSFESFSSFAPT